MAIGITMMKAIKADTTSYALVGERIYPLVYPSNPTFPCITYRVISGVNYPIMSEQVNTTRIQFDIWSYSYDDTAAVKSALMSLFNYYSGTVNSQVIHETKVDLVFDTFEQNIKAHRAVVDVRVMHEGD